MAMKPSQNSDRQAQRYARSDAAFEKAKTLMPGGVSSPARSFASVGRNPITAHNGKGALLTDIDGNSYVDYICSFGPLILGHSPDSVVAAVSKTAAKGSSFGLNSEVETVLAEKIIEAVESIKLIRFVNSGTEAVMSAIRLARGASGKTKVIKCAGCYHGHSDSLLVDAGSGAVTHGTPSSPGVTPATTLDTIVIPYNDLDAADLAMAQNDGAVACLVIEPIAGNMGCIPPADGYLTGLRKLCDKHKALLIFDEVMTGFRVAPGGAQELYGVTPDLTCLGKIIGGGLPCAAYGGRKDLMEQVSPSGPVYQAGTLSGNPLAMAAGAATLEALGEKGLYEHLEQTALSLQNGLQEQAEKAGAKVQISRVGSMMTCFFSESPVKNFADAKNCDLDKFATFFRVMLDEGVLLPPSQFETWFVSTAHDASSVKLSVQAAGKAFAAIA